MKPVVSVIVPTYNEERYIGRLLDSLLAQEFNKPYEILIIDGESQDKTIDIIKTYQKKHNNIHFYTNKLQKPGPAYNIGFAKSKAEFVTIIGAHSQATKHWLARSYETLTKAPKKVVAVGGRLLSGRATTKFARAVDYTTSTFWGGGVSTHRFSTKQQYADTVVFGMYKKDILKKVGVMDTAFVVGQDAEFNYRIRRHGYKLLFNPHIEAIYYSRTSKKKFSKQMYNYGVGRMKILRKHGLHKVSNLLPLLFGLYVRAVPLFIIGGLFAKGWIKLISESLVLPFLLWILITTIMSLRRQQLFKQNFIAYWTTFIQFSSGMTREFFCKNRNNYKK